MASKPKHIVIDARIRRASTGKPVDRLLEYLPKLDTENRYTVLLEPGDNWKPASRKFRTVSCAFRQFSFNPLQQVAYAWQLYRLKPDLVHFTMTGQQPLFYFGKQVTMTHDLTMLNYTRAGRLPEWLHKLRLVGYRLLIWQAHKKAQTIIVPTAYVKAAVAKYHPFTRHKLVVTLEASEPPLTARSLKLKAKSIRKPFILYVGSAFPHKNLESLIKAFEIIKTSQPELHLVLAGKRERYYEQLEKYAEDSPARSAIIFTGFIPAEELKWLYQNAEAYIFPSLSEGFGLPGLEAMVHGCPVVSSNATCLPEVYGDAAHYFDPRNIVDMATKIKEVLVERKLRENFINNGYLQAKKFSWRRMATQTVGVYDRLLVKDN